MHLKAPTNDCIPLFPLLMYADGRQYLMSSSLVAKADEKIHIINSLILCL